MKSIKRSEFRRLVKQVMESLPPEFYDHLDNVVVEVADEPDLETLERAGFSPEEIDAGETLLGFFDPMELPSAWGSDSVDTNSMLHRLWVFRIPHIEEFPDPKQLRVEIRKTVIHELAHHFGWTDRDLERFDATENPFKTSDEDDPAP